MVKSTRCSPRGPGFYSQHPEIPSCSRPTLGMRTLNRYTHAGKIPMHTNCNNNIERYLLRERRVGYGQLWKDRFISVEKNT